MVVVDGAFARESAQEATRRVIERYRPSAIISPGFSGGARIGLKPGDLFLCDRLLCVEGPAAFWRLGTVQELSTGSEAISLAGRGLDDAGQRYTSGTCITVPQLASASSMKRWIGYTFGASVIDMEGFWVSKVAAERDTPVLVVRSVFDPMEQTLPGFIGETLDSQGPQMLGRAIKYVAGHPYEAPKLLRLAAQSRAARASLSDFLLKLTKRDAQTINLAVDTG
jgi:adenosylhomocysteine nucleosidase